jgi:hypothetical protein
MKQQINFSHHAYRRAYERLSMEPDEIADLLERDLTVNIGEEKGSRRVHRLFYSCDDNLFFVAIQDEKSKTVVTILPIDYYVNLFWAVPQSLMKEASELVSSYHYKFEITNNMQGALQQDIELPRLFKISGTYLTREGSQKSVNLGLWPTETYGGSFVNLFRDDKFIQEVQNRFNQIKTSSDYLIGLKIRLGKKGDLIRVDLEQVNFENTKCQHI